MTAHHWVYWGRITHGGSLSLAFESLQLHLTLTTVLPKKCCIFSLKLGSHRCEEQSDVWRSVQPKAAGYEKRNHYHFSWLVNVCMHPPRDSWEMKASTETDIRFPQLYNRIDFFFHKEINHHPSTCQNYFICHWKCVITKTRVFVNMWWRGSWEPASFQYK